MTKKIILYVCMLLVLISFAAATLTENVYYDCEDDVVDQWNDDDGSFPDNRYNANVPTFNTSGDGGTKSCDFTKSGAGDYLQWNGAALPEQATISYWWYIDNCDQSDYISGFENGYGTHHLYESLYCSTPKTAWQCAISSTSCAFDINGDPTGVWYHTLITYDGTDMLVYKNAVLVGNSTTNGFDVMTYNYNTWGAYGAASGNSDFQIDGQIDEIKIFNGSATQSDINSIFNTGAVVPPAPSSYSITATPLDTDPEDENATTELILNITTTLHNITAGNSAKVEYDGANYTATLTRGEYGISGNLTWKVNVTTPIISLNATVESYTWYWNMTINASDEFYNTTSSTQTIVFAYPRINITRVYNRQNGVNLTTFNGSYSDISGTTSFSTTTGSFLFRTTTGNTTITVENEDYAISDENTKVMQINNSGIFTVDFGIYRTNSLWLYWRDEQTLATINNVSLELIGDIQSSNYSTTNGSMYLELITPDLYSMRSNSVGYLERFYYLNLTNQSYNNVTIYLLSNTTGNSVTAKVYDQNSNLVEGAFIYVLRYDVSSSSYILREIAQTNFEGETRLSIILNDEFYKFYVYYPWSTIRKTTAGTYIYNNNINFQINIDELVGETYKSVMDTTQSLYYNDATDNFVFTYSDPNGAVTRACLYVYTTSIVNDDVLHNNSCIYVSSGSIILSAAEVNNTVYVAKAYYTIGGEEQFVSSVIKDYSVDSNFGQEGLFIIFILTILFIFIGYWSKVFALILSPLPILIGSALSWINISFEVAMGLTIAAWVIAIWVSNKDG